MYFGKTKEIFEIQVNYMFALSKKPKNPKNPEVEKSEFYWFGLVYKLKNPTQMVWFDILKPQTNPIMYTPTYNLKNHTKRGQ